MVQCITMCVNRDVSDVSRPVNSSRVAKKTNQKTFRFDDDVAGALSELAPVIEPAKLIRELILAAHRFYKANGNRIYLPMELQPLMKQADEESRGKASRRSA